VKIKKGRQNKVYSWNAY